MSIFWDFKVSWRVGWTSPWGIRYYMVIVVVVVVMLIICVTVPSWLVLFVFSTRPLFLLSVDDIITTKHEHTLYMHVDVL